MAETACLRRSFSNPPEASFDFTQGDPTRALGESISFGRYMSETLAWEKWSTFTQNRYIEEAEKYSKPGSVAKMKAYFEAHYGRFGAKKCVQEKPTDASSRVDVKNDHNTKVLSSSVAFNPVTVLAIDSHTSIQESPTTDHPAVDLLCGTVGLHDSSAQLKDEKTEAASYVESVVVADASVTQSSSENNVQDDIVSAKMKAYFEAHYGRFGAKKCVQEKPTDASSRVDVKNDHNTKVLSSSVAFNPVTVLAIDSHTSIQESPTTDHPAVDLLCGTVGLHDSSAQLKDEKTEAASYVESVVVADASVTQSSSENNVQDDIVSATSERDATILKDVKADAASYVESVVVADARVTKSNSENNVQDARENDIVSATPERNATIKNAVEQEKPEKGKMDTMSEQKLADYSAKRLKKSNLSKLSSSLSRLATPVRSKKEGNGTPNRKVSQLSSSLAIVATPVRPIKEGHATPVNRMFVKESIEKKKLTSSTLHMSINVSSDINKVKKPSPVSSKAGIGKIFTPLGKIIRDSFASSSSTPSRASVNSVSRYPSAIPQSEARRSRVALEKAFDRSRRLDQQLKCPSTGNVKSSTQSPATFASFSFRTEERAAKRREFFQKRLEKEAENFPFTDNTKTKSTPDSRKSSQSRNLKPSTVATVRTEVLSENLKKENKNLLGSLLI
ncbi:uncharacterized protein LOC141623597 isoform X2 [Silene latifolia]|uniref:uncharacterized protein LOC141623597 isoform X2 n=1 Tax=Silene latifolia TaxID=37657 RepID=UPI003D76B31D